MRKRKQIGKREKILRNRKNIEKQKVMRNRNHLRKVNNIDKQKTY